MTHRCTANLAPIATPLFCLYLHTHNYYIYKNIMHISTNVHDVEKWSLYLNISSSVILFHKVDFQPLILMIQSAVRKSSNNGFIMLMIPRERQILTPSFKLLYISFHHSSSVMICLQLYFWR